MSNIIIRDGNNLYTGFDFIELGDLITIEENKQSRVIHILILDGDILIEGTFVVD